VVSFDHREVGTAEALWLGAAQWAETGELALDDVDLLLVVAAHPDDESLGAGGLMVRAHAAGIPVTVVVATAGEHSHPDSPTHSPERLAALRRVEVVQAVDEVASGARVLLLGLPDGALRSRVDVLERAIRDCLADHASALVAAPWRGDGHPDHTIAGEAAASAVRSVGGTLLEYPIWGWHWAEPSSEEWPWARARTVRLDREALCAKAAALSRHRSQVEPLSDAPGDEPIVSETFSLHFSRPFETFFVESDDDDADCSASRSLDREYFDTFYEGRSDPWGFETRWYEERKRALTMASLPRRRFSTALEIGCSIGVLSAELAARCDALLSTDIAEAPLEAARRRVTSPAVRFERRALPEEWPSGRFDLIVVSEVGYYLSQDGVNELARASVSALAPDGVVIACHWRHPVADYPLSGDAVHEAFRATDGLVRLGGYLDDDFVLDVFAAPGTPSVAEAEGLL
jgi:LmbE family N-acetylglucosaminyl deacetylase/protein-L-isoaspartate O-methyltransferase